MESGSGGGNSRYKSVRPRQYKYNDSSIYKKPCNVDGCTNLMVQCRDHVKKRDKFCETCWKGQSVKKSYCPIHGKVRYRICQTCGKNEEYCRNSGCRPQDDTKVCIRKAKTTKKGNSDCQQDTGSLPAQVVDQIPGPAQVVAPVSGPAQATDRVSVQALVADQVPGPAQVADQVPSPAQVADQVPGPAQVADPFSGLGQADDPVSSVGRYDGFLDNYLVRTFGQDVAEHGFFPQTPATEHGFFPQTPAI